MTKYKCPECGWVGTSDEMGADYYYISDSEEEIVDEVWSNWICPGCEHWHFGLDSYQEIVE